MISGPNGAGKTNLLEALYFGCTGRSCRTNNEREVVRFGAGAARVVVNAVGEDGPHELSVGFVPGQPKRMRVDGAPVERLLDVDRSAAGERLPARPARADQGRTALFAARTSISSSPRCGRRGSATRRAYAQALAQRNALIARIRSGRGSRGVAGDVGRAAGAVRDRADGRPPPCGRRDDADRSRSSADELGLDGEPSVAYRPRSRATDAAQLAAELAERAESDIERGFTGHGPHRDDLATRARRPRAADVRITGPAATRAAWRCCSPSARRSRRTRSAPPLMLLDDVMSELDGTRRQRARRAPARRRRPIGDHDDGPRARAGRAGRPA